MSILLTPARIGGVEIKNRIIMPPMTTRLSDDEGHATDDVANLVAFIVSPRGRWLHGATVDLDGGEVKAF